MRVWSKDYSWVLTPLRVNFWKEVYKYSILQVMEEMRGKLYWKSTTTVKRTKNLEPSCSPQDSFIRVKNLENINSNGIDTFWSIIFNLPPNGFLKNLGALFQHCIYKLPFYFLHSANKLHIPFKKLFFKKYNFYFIHLWLGLGILTESVAIGKLYNIFNELSSLFCYLNISK